MITYWSENIELVNISNIINVAIEIHNPRAHLMALHINILPIGHLKTGMLKSARTYFIYNVNNSKVKVYEMNIHLIDIFGVIINEYQTQFWYHIQLVLIQHHCLKITLLGLY